MGNGPEFKLGGEKLFDETQGVLNDEERKKISEHLDEFKSQFGSFKSEILHNLDTANKDILEDLDINDPEAQERIKGITDTIESQGTYADLYATTQTRDRPRQLMAIMQMGAAICVTVMNTSQKQIKEVLENEFYKNVKNGWFDGKMWPNTTSVFIDILSRGKTTFDGTITKELIKTIYEQCHTLDGEKSPKDGETKNPKEADKDFPSKTPIETENFTGAATVLYPDGSTYKGAFVEGSRKGKGKLTYADGKSKDGERDVEWTFITGTEYDKDGKIVATYQDKVKTIVGEKPPINPEDANKDIEKNNAIAAQKLYAELNSWKAVDLTKIDKKILEWTEQLFVDALLKLWVKVDDKTSKIEKSEPVIKLRKLVQQIVDELGRRTKEDGETKNPDVITDPNTGKEKEKTPDANNTDKYAEINNTLKKLQIDEQGIFDIKNAAEIIYSPDQGDKDTEIIKFIQQAIDATDNGKTGSERLSLIISRMAENFSQTVSDFQTKLNEEIRKWFHAAPPLWTLELPILQDKLEKIIRMKIEKTNLKELFEADKDTEYFNHLAANLGQVEKTDDGYIAKYSILKDPSVKGTNGQYLPTKIMVHFDEKWNITDKKITMPKMFGAERVYQMENGKFIENKDTKTAREKMVEEQKRVINEMIATTVQWSNVFQNAEIKWDIDIDGNYNISFNVWAVKIKDTKIESIPGQSFQVHFDDTGKIELTDEREYITSEKLNLGKKWKAVFDILIDKNGDEKPFFNIDVTRTKQKEKQEAPLTFTWLTNLTIYYDKIEDKKNKWDINVISATPGDKYYDLVTLETTKNGERLKSPDMMKINPLGNSEGEETSKYIEDFKIKNKSLIEGLQSENYEISDAEIDEVIAEYNKPMREKVYPIMDPKTKEISYYTAEKKDTTITFTKDADIIRRINEAKKNLEARFIKIKTNYEKEKLALKKVNETKFETKGADLGIYTLENAGVNILKNQKKNILSEKYDTEKVQYTINVKYLNKDNVIEPKGIIYFDSKWAYDTKENTAYYAKDKNKPTMEGKIGTFEPKKNGVIFFFDEAQKNKSF